MEFAELVTIASRASIFSSGFLTAGAGSSRELIQQQLSRWSRQGKIIQLRRGMYMLAPPYQKVTPHPFTIANRMKSGSYVSLQSALAYVGMIPEEVPVVTSVTTGRPELVTSEVGTFLYRHVKSSLFWGYSSVRVATEQDAFIAYPEKALLDLIYLTPHAESLEYIQELRLQHWDRIDRKRLREFVVRYKSRKITKALRVIEHVMEEQYEEL